MGNERLSWLDRWRLYRDRLITSSRVQRWALANPLTRPVAQRRARAMLDLCAGFVYSQVLFTCVRLRLFDILFKEPLTIAALAKRLSLSPEATSRLLDAAVSLGLVERRGRSVYGLGQLGAALAGNRAALSLIEHQPLCSLRDPVALLRGSSQATGIARYWPYSAGEPPTARSWPHRSLSLRRKCSIPTRSTGIAAFSTSAVAKEFSSPRRQHGRRPTPHAFRPARCGQAGSCPSC